jgi:hypothetical protein
MAADELRAAAVDVLSHRVGEQPTAGWLRDNDGSRAALTRLARAVAACPGDDHLPVTEAWLRAVGRKVVPGFGVPLTPLLSLWNSSSGWHLFFHNGEGDGFMPDADTNGPVLVANAHTRGDVRLLAKVYGIPLSES